MTVDMIKESEVSELAREIAEYEKLSLKTVETDADTWIMKVADTDSTTRHNLNPSALGKFLQADGTFDSWVDEGDFLVQVQPERFLSENNSPREV